MISKATEFITTFDMLTTAGLAATGGDIGVTVSQNASGFVAAVSGATRIESTNVFKLVLTAAEMDADIVTVAASGAGMVPYTVTLHPETTWTAPKANYLNASVSGLVEQLLVFDWTTVTSEVAARSVLNALRALRNKVGIESTTLTVTKEDDSTAAWTATLTPSASGTPFSVIDPD